MVAAERLGRQWAGIDIDEVAIGITQKRLQDESDASVHNVDLDGLREGLPPPCTCRPGHQLAPTPTVPHALAIFEPSAGHN